MPSCLTPPFPPDVAALCARHSHPLCPSQLPFVPDAAAICARHRRPLPHFCALFTCRRRLIWYRLRIREEKILAASGKSNYGRGAVTAGGGGGVVIVRVMVGVVVVVVLVVVPSMLRLWLGCWRWRCCRRHRLRRRSPSRRCQVVFFFAPIFITI